MREDPLRPKLSPLVFVEPKDSGVSVEIVRQAGIVTAIRSLAKGCIVWAVPNAAQSDRAKLRQLREGAVYGAADLTIIWNGGCAFIEVKTGRTMPRGNQVEFLNAVVARGHSAAVCRTTEGALGWLRSLGAPVPEARA